MSTQPNETMSTTANTERVTRGAGNRKPTEKYALFQQAKQGVSIRHTRRGAKEAENSSAEGASVSSVINEEAEANMGDEYILHLCKQQSFKKNEDADDILDTANSTPEKAEKCTEENQKSRQTLEFEDLDDILENTKERYMKSKQLALQEQRSSSAKKANQKLNL